VSQELVYEIAKISDQPFLLPEKSELNSKQDGHYLVKNVISYHLYRKFSTEEKIIYEEIPEEKPPVKKQP